MEKLNNSGQKMQLCYLIKVILTLLCWQSKSSMQLLRLHFSKIYILSANKDKTV